MGSLHHPAPRLLTRLPLDGLRLLALRGDVRREGELPGGLADFVIGVALVQAQVLFAGRLRVGAWDGNTLQRLPDQLHVGAVGAVYGQADRDAVGLDHQAALDALFGAVGGVLARLFPPRGVPWSCTRPCSARTSRSPSGSRIRAGRPSTSRR